MALPAQDLDREDAGQAIKAGKRPSDPLRTVVAAFRDPEAFSRARRELTLYGLRHRLDVVVPRRGASPGRERPTLNGKPSGLGAIGSPRLRERCLELLRDQQLLVIAVARILPERGKIEEIFAEHGGLVLGSDGRIYPAGV